jgi:hypothetical protein
VTPLEPLCSNSTLSRVPATYFSRNLVYMLDQLDRIWTSPHHPDGSATVAWWAATTPGASKPAKLIAFHALGLQGRSWRTWSRRRYEIPNLEEVSAVSRSSSPSRAQRGPPTTAQYRKSRRVEGYRRVRGFQTVMGSWSTPASPPSNICSTPRTRPNWPMSPGTGALDVWHQPISSA